MRDPGLEKALAAVGGVAALARALGVTKGAVSQWRRIPLERLPSVARVTGLPPRDLAPARHAGFAEAQLPREAQAPSPADEARALGLDADAIASDALGAAIRREKERRWLAENAAAIEGWNRWTEENGLPLAEYRMF